MTRADLLKEIADHHYALADLYQQLAGDSATAPVSAAGPAAAAGTVAPATKNAAYETTQVTHGEGSLEVCPKHRKPYTPGTYGPYCKEFTDDPAFAKVKPDGRMFCNITPATAAEYLRVKAAA